MTDFLDIAERLWKSGEVGNAADEFACVFDTIAGLQQVHSKSELDLTNIESVFAVLEMARTLGALPGTPPDRIDHTVHCLKRLIVKTLEHTLLIPVSGTSPSTPVPYDEFCLLLDDLRREAKPTRSVAVLTFNYDMAMDIAMHRRNVVPEYGLGETNPKARAEVPLLKLHGSLNWATCPECGGVVPWRLRDYFSRFRWDMWPGTENVILNIGSNLAKYTHCGKEPVRPDPLLVPPTWNKGGFHESIAGVWKAAAVQLAEAESIFVIGYSLPTTDAFFRYLYALGTFGPRLLKHFWVCNPDDSGEVESRFRELLGPAARVRFRYIPETFARSIGHIKNEYPSS